MTISIETNGAAEVSAESKAWEERCAELTQERDQLREDLAKAQSERDSYLKSLYYFLRKDAPPPDFTKEELFAHADDKPSIHDVIAELEKGLENRP
jgi:hypothetical protein